MAGLPKHLPRAIIIAVPVLAIVLMGFQCRKGGAGPGAGEVAGEPIPVDAVFAERIEVDRTVDIAGAVKPLLRAEIAPRVMARITNVTVREGESIGLDQVLVTLDASEAQARKMEAEGAVAAANAKLDQARIAVELQKTQSEVRVAQAEQGLNMAKAGPREEEKAQAESGVKQAQASVDAAKAQLEMLKEGSRKQDKASADQVVAEAEAALEQAKANLQKAENGPRAQEVESARQEVARAEAGKRQAEAGLDKAKEGARAQEKAQADEAVELAQAEFNTVDATYQRMKALFEAEVISAQAFDEVTLKRRAAEGKLKMAKQQASLVHEGTRTQDIAAAEEQVKGATSALAQAQQALSEMEEGTRSEDKAAAQYQVRMAEAAVEQARQRASAVNEGPRSQEIKQGEEAVRQAEAMLEIAQKQLDMAKAGGRPEEVRLAEQGVKLAQSSTKETDLRQRDVEAAEAGLAQANAAAQRAQVAVDDATIKAPFDGVILERKADPGDLGMPGMPVLVVQPTGAFELECAMPEAQAKSLKLGDQMPITIDAAGPTPLLGTIATITPAEDGATRSSIVDFMLPPTEGLRTGMFGRVSVPIGKRTGIFLPQVAVWRHESLTGLFVLEQGRAKLRLVRLGKPVGDRIEVTSGLEGTQGAEEKVIVSETNRLVDGSPVCPKAG